MALDRFVHWKDKAPTKEQLKDCLAAYFYGVLGNGYRWEDPLFWHTDRWFVTVQGCPSWQRPRRVDDAEERAIEVWPKDDCIDVITRQADDITNAIAEGLAKLLARRFEGRIEEP